MISCKKATELLSKQMEEKLTIADKAALLIHLYICEFCEQFRKHIELMRDTLRDEKSPPEESGESCEIAENERMSPDAKRKLLENLKSMADKKE